MTVATHIILKLGEVRLFRKCSNSPPEFAHKLFNGLQSLRGERFRKDCE